MSKKWKAGDSFMVRRKGLLPIDRRWADRHGYGPYVVTRTDADGDVYFNSGGDFYFSPQYIKPYTAPGTDSNTLTAALTCLRAQEKKGLNKYGTTLDTAGLSTREIARHYQQEAADALMYATALVKALEEQEGQK